MTPAALSALNGRVHPIDWKPPLYIYVEHSEVQAYQCAGYVALGSVGCTGRTAMLFSPGDVLEPERAA